MHKQEVSAFKKCAQIVAAEAINRLLDAKSTLPKHRSQVLRCEFLTLLLRLRRESEKEAAVSYSLWLERENLQAWVSGTLVRVMPTAN